MAPHTVIDLSGGVTWPLAEIATLIVLYVELPPRCNESHLSPRFLQVTARHKPSQLCGMSIMYGNTSSDSSQKSLSLHLIGGNWVKGC